MLVINAHEKDLGGFFVRRLLPAARARSISSFVFFDHMGPAQFAPGQGVDVRPHPHIGLATVTYLFDGAIVHRDSLGTVQRIEPGDVNWMTAGHGIVHSERTDPADRVGPDGRGPAMHGLQIWVALPKSHEQTEPAFTHIGRDRLPLIEAPGVEMRLIVGEAFGQRAPTPSFSPICYLAVSMAAGARLDWPADLEERGLYLVDGELSVGGQTIAPRQMLAWTATERDARDMVGIEARTGSTLVLFGGDRLDGERLLSWNFVASSHELIERARQRWRDGAFPPVPGETGFIPLPD